MRAVSISIIVGTAMAIAAGASAQSVDLIVTNGKVHTMDDAKPIATAFAVREGKFIAVGSDAEINRLKGEGTRIIDAQGHTIIPGLNDSHAHVIRGGRFYNLELRWDRLLLRREVARICLSGATSRSGGCACATLSKIAKVSGDDDSKIGTSQDTK